MKHYNSVLSICFLGFLVFLGFHYFQDSPSVAGQESALDLTSKCVLAIIEQDRNAYLECYLKKDRLFAEKSYELECLHREFIQKLMKVYGLNAWEQYKEAKVGRSWVLRTSFELLKNEKDALKFAQETSVYFCSENKALWDPPVGVVALKKKGDNWFFNPKESCDVKSSIKLFQWNIDVYRKVIPKIQTSDYPLVELKMDIMDVYFDD